MVDSPQAVAGQDPTVGRILSAAMRTDQPSSVAEHFALCTAMALAASGAPFVPETVFLYAGACYLRHFLYGNRLWQAPARVPLHLGRRGYRDATLRRRGAATWPLGTTVPDGQQVWLLREDLARGSVYIAEDPDWHAEMTARLIHGACLHQMGAIVVQAHHAPCLFPRLAEIARPFGRDAEMATVDLHDAGTAPLRLTESAIMAALAGQGLTPSAHALARVLLPLLAWLGPRLSYEPLTLFPTLLDPALLKDLASGALRLGGIDLSSADARSADTSVLTALSRPLDEITEDQQARACDELRPYARELAAASGLSISRGLSLSAAMAARRITCIRPSSSWTTTLVATDCIEALATFAPESLSNEILYIAGSVLSASLPPSRLIDAAKHAGSDLVLAFYENITVQRFAQIFETQGVSIYRSASDADRSVNLSASLDRTRQELGLQVYEFD